MKNNKRIKLSRFGKDPEIFKKQDDLASLENIETCASTDSKKQSDDSSRELSSWSINENIRQIREKYDVKGRGIKIAILDTGVNVNHECFRSEEVKTEGFNSQKIIKTINCFMTAPIKKKIFEKRVGRRNIYKTIEIPVTDVEDAVGHGTFCAGVAAGYNEDISVAPEAELYIAKVLDDTGEGTVTSVTRGINWAIEQGVHIISMSFGYTGDLDVSIKAALEKAISQNIIVLCAAGNEGPYKNTISSPGNFTKIITVGAHDKNNKVAYFSSRGAQLDFVAPGVDIVCCYSSKDIPIKDNDISYAILSGTSMATPFVAGCAALFLEYYLRLKKEKENSTVNTPLLDTSLGVPLTGIPLTGIPLTGVPLTGCLCQHFEDCCKKNCIDLGLPGFDTDYGAGKIFLDFEKFFCC